MFILDSKGIPDSISSCLEDDVLFCAEFGPATVGVLSWEWLLCVVDALTCKPDVSAVISRTRFC